MQDYSGLCVMYMMSRNVVCSYLLDKSKNNLGFYKFVLFKLQDGYCIRVSVLIRLHYLK